MKEIEKHTITKKFYFINFNDASHKEIEKTQQERLIAAAKM